MVKKEKSVAPVTLESFKTLRDLQQFCTAITPPLRQSSMGTCISCPRKYMYQYRMFLKPKKTSFISAANKGSILHKCLELDNEDAFNEWVMDEVKRIRLLATPEDDTFNEIDKTINSYIQQVQMVKMMVTLFKEQVKMSPAIRSVKKEKTILAALKLSETGPTIYITGTLDQLLYDDARKRYGVRDYKTTSRDADYAYAGYTFSLQNRMYRLLAYAATKEAPSFFILNVMRFPSIVMSGQDRNYTTKTKVVKSGPNKGEIREEKSYIGEPVFANYLERCKLWYRNNAAQSLTSTCIFYGEPLVTPELLGYLKSCWYYAIRPVDTHSFLRDITNNYCKAYNKVCPFMGLCQSSERTHLDIMKHNFVMDVPEERPHLDGATMEWEGFDTEDKEIHHVELQ